MNKIQLERNYVGQEENVEFKTVKYNYQQACINKYNYSMHP